MYSEQYKSMRKDKFTIHSIVILLVSILFISCGTKKKMMDTTEETSEALLINAYSVNQLAFNQLEFGAKAGFQSETFSVDFDGVFRMKKEEAIWGVFKKFGFEVARIYIRPDSVFVLNRFEKKYIAEDIGQLKEMTGVPLEFADLEQMLVGGSFWTNGLKQLNDSTLVQQQVVQGKLIEATHIFTDQKLISRSSLQSKGQGSLDVDYKDHIKVENATLASSRKFFAEREGTNVILELKTQNFDLESTKQMPFEIPKSYTRQSM